MSVSYLDQDFAALRADCLKRKQLFRDPKFPAEATSLGFKDLGPDSEFTQGLVWKRPTDICSKPQFITEDATRDDVVQGAVGDCWLMAAIASLSLNQDLLRRVIFPEQNFTDNYAGIFHFLLWQYGKWVHVVVDDLLPTKNGKLVFVHSGNKSEFWSALLEKAYAKVNGSYEALEEGLANEALTDFTGGIGERYNLSEAPPDLFSIMKKAVGCGYPLGTSISGQGAEDRQKKTSECLVKTHEYSITGIEEVLVGGRQQRLVRLRNPWGYFEWNGAWSDKSKEWDQVPPAKKSKLAYAADDGEFWMSYSDFIQRFSTLEICHLTPDDPSENEGCWNYYEFEGAWRAGSSAGGCSNNTVESFSTNPQFVVKLDVDSNKDQKCSVLVALMQKDYRQFRQKGIRNNSVGVEIYKLPDKYKGRSGVRLSSDDLMSLTSVGTTRFTNTREVCARFKLSLGEYVLIPCTFAPSKEGSFLLRVFSEK